MKKRCQRQDWLETPSTIKTANAKLLSEDTLRIIEHMSEGKKCWLHVTNLSNFRRSSLHLCSCLTTNRLKCFFLVAWIDTTNIKILCNRRQISREVFKVSFLIFHHHLNLLIITFSSFFVSCEANLLTKCKISYKSQRFILFHHIYTLEEFEPLYTRDLYSHIEENKSLVQRKKVFSRKSLSNSFFVLSVKEFAEEMRYFWANLLTFSIDDVDLLTSSCFSIIKLLVSYQNKYGIFIA